MRGKFAFVVGAAVGYVLGSRAGRQRYEQIRRGATRLWNTTPVQKGVQVVRGAVDERADDFKDAARRVGSQLLSKMAEQTAAKARKPASGSGAQAPSPSSEGESTAQISEPTSSTRAQKAPSQSKKPPTQAQKDPS